MNKENELTEFMAKAIMDSGKTYSDLSLLTGLSVATIRKIVDGETEKLQAKTIAALMKALRIPPGEIGKYYND